MFTRLTGLVQNPRHAKLVKALAAYDNGTGDLDVLVSEELAEDPYVQPAELAEVLVERREYAAWKASLSHADTWDKGWAA